MKTVKGRRVDFDAWDNVVDFGEPGPGTELLSFNFKKKLLVVGCSSGIYLLNTFKLHGLRFKGDEKLFKVREKYSPQILLKTPPLKIVLSSDGNIIGVKTIEGVFLYEIEHPKEPVRSFKGKIKDFDISGNDVLGILYEETMDLKLFFNFWKFVGFHMTETEKVTCFSFISGTDGTSEIVIGLDSGEIIFFCFEGEGKRGFHESIDFKFKLPLDNSKLSIRIDKIMDIDGTYFYANILVNKKEEKESEESEESEVSKYLMEKKLHGSINHLHYENFSKVTNLAATCPNGQGV